MSQLWLGGIGKKLETLPQHFSTFYQLYLIFDVLRAEMVGQRRHFAEIKNPEKFWNSR